MQDLCVIVPCYNESERLQTKAFSEYIKNKDVYFCFVNDGSSDNTIDILYELKHSLNGNIDVVDLKNNSGKAEAVRQGLLHATKWKPFDYLAYFDADLAVPLQDIDVLYDFARSNTQFKLTMGARLKRMGATIKRSPIRHFFGRIFATFASNMFKFDAYDTQCGLKLFQSETAKIIFQKPFYSKWFFDIEILLRFKVLVNNSESYNNICEIPLTAWEEVSGSKLKIKDFIIVPFELMRLKRKYKKFSA